jgi:pseudaminic acid synthase
MTPPRNKTFEIAGRPIGADHPPYVVAELSGNHNGDLSRALALVEMAKEAGADAVKLQTYTADTITIDHDSPEFWISGGLWDGRSLHELYDEAHTPWDWHPALFDKAREIGITIFSAPFDATAVTFLKTLDVPAYKIASFEAVDLPLIAQVAATGKPMIISTGMADLDEIGEAVGTARNAGCSDLVLLHCVSGYPTPAGESNLRTMSDLAERFEAVVGLSDHTLGTAVSVAAVSLGATLIEKHVTLSRADGGPDSSFSLEPDELALLVSSCRDAWEALGDVNYERKESESGNAMFRRSIYAVADIMAGEVLTDTHIRSIRPGFGLAPKHLPELLGRRAKQAIPRGTAMSWDLVD